jgi:hypothetical protein
MYCCIHSYEAPEAASMPAILLAVLYQQLDARRSLLLLLTKLQNAASDTAPAHQASTVRSRLQPLSLLRRGSGDARAAVLFSTAARCLSALDLLLSGLCAQLAGGHDEVHTDGQQHQHQTGPAGETRNGTAVAASSAS